MSKRIFIINVCRFFDSKEKNEFMESLIDSTRKRERNWWIRKKQDECSVFGIHFYAPCFLSRSFRNVLNNSKKLKQP